MRRQPDERLPGFDRLPHAASGQKWTVCTLRTAQELAEFVEESEKEAAAFDLEEIVEKQMDLTRG